MNNDLFEKLAAQEADFSKSEFLSPVIQGRPIRVRIAGIVMTLRVTRPKKFQGWGVFRAVNFKEARRIREPNLKQKQEYLSLFPCLRLILCRRTEKQWFGIPAHESDTRFKVQGTVPVNLPEEVQLFDAIKTRFDGGLLWFEGIDERHNPKTARYLRDAITAEIEPKDIQSPGLTIEERDAYQIAFNDLVESKKDREEERIKKAIQHGGGKYKSYIERANTYTIEFTVDGNQHRSTVNKDNLQVQTAGVCLAGHDTNFDLASLVGVLREGQSGRGRGYYHYNDDYDYD